MDSSDDMMHDAESVDDDFYSGETAMDSEDDADVDYEFVVDNDSDDDDSDDFVSNRNQLNYTILNEVDIHQRQEDDIKKISSILSISKVAAAILLRHYNWSHVGITAQFPFGS
nr:probable E3 ubiquitin-protein ligase ARI8 isoform X1 [Tanacetum cinerariifolium]